MKVTRLKDLLSQSALELEEDKGFCRFQVAREYDMGTYKAWVHLTKPGEESNIVVLTN